LFPIAFTASDQADSAEDPNRIGPDMTDFFIFPRPINDNNVVIVMAVHGQRRTPLATMRGAQRKKPTWNRSLRRDDLIIRDSPGAVECPPSQVPTELGAVDSDIE
jgi:hypothetical protein